MTTTTRDADILDELRVDHDHQRTLLVTLLETHGDSPERREAFLALRVALEAHAAAEERHFYTTLMVHDLTIEKARHSVAEHKEMDDFVELLESYDLAAPQWIITAREMADRIRHHLEEEEREVFPLAGKVLADDDRASAALGYRAEMDDLEASSGP